MRIAHFSDLHVLDLAGVAPHRFLNKRLTGYANIHFKRGHVHRRVHVESIAREIARAGVDHVAITGDLTNLALETEYAAVRGVIEQALGMPPDQVSVVPGNHDLYTRGAMKSRRFTEWFGDYTTSDLPELVVSDGLGRFPFVRLRGPCAVIGMSSAVPRLPLVAAGSLGGRQLDALARVLAHPEVTKRVPVVLLHHPPHNPTSRLRSLIEGLWDADVLAHRVRDVSHGLILHGHLHKRQQRALHTSRGRMHAVGAGSASLDDALQTKMAGFNLYEIDDAGQLVRMEAHVVDASSGTFRVETIPTV